MSDIDTRDMADEAKVNEAPQASEKEPVDGKDTPVSNLEKLSAGEQSMEYSKLRMGIKDCQCSCRLYETCKLCPITTSLAVESDGQSAQNVSKLEQERYDTDSETVLNKENQINGGQILSNVALHAESFIDTGQSKSDLKKLGGPDRTSSKQERKADAQQDNTSSGEKDGSCENTEISQSRCSSIESEADVSKLDLDKSNALEPSRSMSPVLNDVMQSTDSIAFSWCELCFDETSEKVKVAGFCSDCNCFICRPCLNAHKKSPASRMHHIQLGTRMPKSINDKPIKFQACHLHSGNLKSKFCLHHGETACSDCLQEQHYDCKTTSIHNVCKDLDKENIKQLIDTIKCTQNTASIAETAIESNITDAENQRKGMIKDVKNLQVKLVAKAEEMCTEMITEISDVSSRTRERMSDQVQILSDIANSFSETVLNLERLQDKHIDTNLFIRIQEIVEAALLTKSDFDNIRKEMNKIQLSFSLDSAVPSFLSASNKLGNVKEGLSPIQGIMEPLTEISFPKMLETEGRRELREDKDPVRPPSPGSSQSQLRDPINEAIKPGSATVSSNAATSSIEDNSKGSSMKHLAMTNPLVPSTTEDENPCNIWGMDVTSNGTLIITDAANKAVKIFSADNRHLSSVLLTYKPYGAVVIDDMTAAVSTSCDIFLLDISDPCSASVRKSFRLGYWASSMTMCNDSLVVIKASECKVKHIAESGENVWEWVNVFGVCMIDLEGHELWAAPEENKGEKMFERPYSLAVTVIVNKTSVLVTDWMKHRITLLDASNGYLLRKIDAKGKGPHGITVDSDLNVYVCCVTSKEICMWSENLEQSKTLLSGKDLPAHPVYIAYCDNLDGLYVCCRNKSTIYRIALPAAET